MSNGSDAIVELGTLDRLRGELEARHPGWRVWYVPTVNRGVLWCAHPLPVLDRGSSASLDEAITAASGGLDGLLRRLLAAGYEVSFSGEPEGTVAHVEIRGGDGQIAVTHTSIADTPQGALEAAAFGAASCAGQDAEAALGVRRHGS